MFRLFEDQPDAAGYQNRLDKFSKYIRNTMGTPAILAVQEVESITTLQDVADQMNTDEPTLSYTAFLVEGNDVGGIDGQGRNLFL